MWDTGPLRVLREMEALLQRAECHRLVEGIVEAQQSDGRGSEDGGPDLDHGIGQRAVPISGVGVHESNFVIAKNLKLVAPSYFRDEQASKPLAKIPTPKATFE